MLPASYNQGVARALARFKLAETVLGASPGVMPKGPEMSHGTEAISSYKGPREQDPTSNQPLLQSGQEARQEGTDWLWNISEYDRLAPGEASGNFGSENIG